MIHARSVLTPSQPIMTPVLFRSFPLESLARTYGPTHGWLRCRCHSIMSSQPSIAASSHFGGWSCACSRCLIV